ncbi:type II toxin-antitoxin system VapB family antitoxin [Pseudomonas panipatensis]|uniref:type II toxin-antitoxin system VapB family antitoxin n=1 Tax=Pseudomonas panipatensis TaxID=428992 RepID=UPI001113EEC7|nr:type II toxin-antitoxin system VapB family antitoxin [Pseudomonas panipatensis]
MAIATNSRAIEIEVFINDKLYAEARKAVGEDVSDKELVELALNEFIRFQKEKRALSDRKKSLSPRSRCQH